MPESAKLFEFLGDDSQNDTADRERIEELAAMIEQIDGSIRKALQHYATRNELTLLEAQSLGAILKLGENARVTAIAESVRIPLSTMTGVASRLEKSGLVERKRASDDARAFVLTLTNQGFARSQQLFRPFFGAVKDVLRDADNNALEKILDSFKTVRDLASELEQRLDTSDPD